MTEIKYKVTDAADEDETRQIILTTYQHGLSIEVEGDDRCIVVDLSLGLLSVYVTNEHGDIQDKARISLELRPVS
jgi:alkylated DNA repair dioxygenase AlkB